MRQRHTYRQRDTERGGQRLNIYIHTYVQIDTYIQTENKHTYIYIYTIRHRLTIRQSRHRTRHIHTYIHVYRQTQADIQIQPPIDTDNHTRTEAGPDIYWQSETGAQRKTHTHIHK